jgi:TPR repeat protein
MGEAPIAAEETDHGFAAQRARAEAYEAEGNWVQALMIWIAAAGETIPAHASGARSSAGVLVERLREAPAQMAGGQFEELEPVLRRGVEIGIDSASMLLGEELRRRGRPEDAFEVFQESASNGYAPAMIQIGLMYSNGDGTRKDLEKASSWLRPANVKGDAAGKYLLAECFLFGKGVGKNEVLAVTLLEESVEMGGPARALDLLGTCNHKAWGKPQNSMEAARLYGLACDRGFYNACANLSVLTMRGDGVEQDPERAIALIKKGADAGNPLCMFFYGASFLDGLGVPQDHDVAAQWMKKAAALENANAKRWCREQGLTWEEESSNSH